MSNNNDNNVIPYQAYDDENRSSITATTVNTNLIDINKQLDPFLTKVYFYYTRGGFIPILWNEISYLIIYLFIIFFIIFLSSFINYNCIITAQNTPLSTCLQFSASNIQVLTWLIVSSIGIFWILNIIQFIAEIPELNKIRKFYTYDLQITDIQGVEWSEIVNKMQNHRADLKLDELSIASRIMRTDNYLIAIFDNDILGLQLFYTKSIEWALKFCFWNYIFIDGRIRDTVLYDFNKARVQLRMRIDILGALFLLLSPLILIYLMIYYSCSYFDQIKNSPSILGGRI